MKSALRDCSNSLRAMLERQLRDDVDLSPFFDPTDTSPGAIGTFVVSLNNPEEFSENELEGLEPERELPGGFGFEQAQRQRRPSAPSARTWTPSSSRRSRTRNWKADQAPGLTSTMR